MPEVVLYIAMSLDGFIAREDGSVDWLNSIEDTPEALARYESFYNSIDTLVMGRATYDQVLGFGTWPYEGKVTHVVSHRGAEPDDPNTEVRFTDRSIIDLVRFCKQESKKDLWLVGGASLIDQFEAEGLIDRLRITVVPIRLGSGIPLFRCGRPQERYEFVEAVPIGEMAELHYRRADKSGGSP